MAHTVSGSYKALNTVFLGMQFLGSTGCDYDQNKATRPAMEDIIASSLVREIPLKYKRNPMTDSAETISTNPDSTDQSSGAESAEYRIGAITWHTPDFVNTCHMDSFLSAWLRRVRQTHGHVLRFLENNDVAGKALRAIADLALCRKQALSSVEVKTTWLKVAFHHAGVSLAYEPFPIDCIGHDVASVFQHCRAHCSVVLETKCLCGVQFHREFAMDISKIPMILQLMEARDPHLLKITKCRTCNTNPNLVQVTRAPGNWMLVFKYWNSRVNPEFSEIPKGLNLDGATYELVYLGYCQQEDKIQHHVSIHNIRGYYHLYDGIHSPKFRKWAGKRYAKKNARLETIVYFRRT